MPKTDYKKSQCLLTNNRAQGKVSERQVYWKWYKTNVFCCCYNILCDAVLTVSGKEREWAYAYPVLIREKETVICQIQEFLLLKTNFLKFALKIKLESVYASALFSFISSL